ncbi:MAG: hypothetical protein KC652_29165, partial [Cyanobacteria bacterium HKST-UBA01]|nr:hypothetical protein [Cyanobacteria bacterium HKST-UBA01]
MAGTQNDRKREQFLREWLEANHNGKCRHVNRGAWRLLEGHIRRACEWRPSDYQPGFERTPYAITERSTEAMVGLTKKTGHLWKPEDLERANQKREKEARARIREAAIWIVENGASRTISEIARIAQASRDTVRKHS